MYRIDTRELDKELLLISTTIYTVLSWSVLQHYITDPKVHALSSYPITHSHVFSIRPLCFLHVPCVTNFIQLISPQPVDRFSQTKLHWKAPNEGYPHICGMYKSNNERLRYQAISSCKSFVC